MANTQSGPSGGTYTYNYSNETFSGIDMVASITISNNGKTYNKIIGELQTVSYSIHMEKKPVRSIGNVNAKDYVMGPRTIAGSLVFSVFNKHFSQDLVDNINGANSSGTVFLVDELPPFDLILSAANEYGYRSRLVIYGIRLLNEGQVMSVNDVYTENTYQFFATDLEYLTDEMVYTRSKEDRKYKLTDTVPYTPDYTMYTYHNADLDKTEAEKQKAFWDKISSQAIDLSCSVKQPTRSNNQGIVDFFLKPGQPSGIIHVTDTDGNATDITVRPAERPDGNNTCSYVSSTFFPGTYTAYFSNTSDKKSNEIKFLVKQFVNSKTDSYIVPLVDKITSKSVSISTSNTKHNKVLLSTLYGDKLNSYDIANGKSTLPNLDENTSYTIRTYCDKDNDSSDNVQFKTLSDYKAYTDLTNYLKANKNVLSINNISDYTNIIDENKDEDLTPLESIIKGKSKYQNQLSTLDLGSPTYREDKKNLENKILICSSIINIAAKMNNDLISAVNKMSNVPAPVLFLDENYDNIFQFDENITSAEFFRVYDKVEQYATTVESYNFRTISGKTNCFRFLGKPGVTHYVQAIVNNVRSSKVKFYVMTQEEKQDYINKQMDKDKLTDADISKLNATIHNDLTNTISTLDEQRAFLIKTKKMTDDKVMAPTILSIEENVLVQTFINCFSSNDNTFYLSVASYNDVLYNNDIYKIPFTSKDEVVTISNLYNGIKENNVYAVWIENSDFKQLSNATTFTYVPGTDANDSLTNYGLKDLVQDINDIASEELPANVSASIQGTIENNSGITSNEIISSAIDIATNSVMSKTNLLNFLYRIKKYIGIFVDPDTSYTNNIQYNTSSISFDSSNDGTILIYDLDQIKDIKLESSNVINLNDYQGNILVVVAVDNSLNSKSSVLVIDKTEKYMEVL